MNEQNNYDPTKGLNNPQTLTYQDVNQFCNQSPFTTTTTITTSSTIWTTNLSPIAPEVYILVNGDRKKTEGNVVYLKDADEFVLEVFNKWTTPIAMSMTLNGKAGTKMIVINPGQRLKLDRHLETDAKLKFSTYNVDDSKEALTAIANNGKIELSFFEEESVAIFNNNPIWTVNQYEYPQFPDYNKNIFYYGSPIQNSTISLNDLNVNNTSSVNINVNSTITSNKEIETGRIENGNKSEQQFVDTHKKFKLFGFNFKTFILMPESRKPLEAKDLIKKCTGCNKKQKRKDKFCPSCGNKN